MEKYIYDNNNGLWYELRGDYYIPCLMLSKKVCKPIGLWGQRHLRYIKEHRKAYYTGILLGGNLNSYLAEIDARANEMLDRLTRQMAEKQGIAEEMKVQDQLAWVGAMNNIRSAAEEIVNTEIIYM